MRITRLYIRDFFCYDHAFVDFSEFSSALIVGIKQFNDDVSNGVGKTTMFKAIEYALFNHADIKLEDIIRDDADSCNVTVDFIVGNQEFRLTRTRTRKGITDVTFYQRTSSDGEEMKALHTIRNDIYEPLSDEKYWKDISGRRAADTEKEINKLIKINIKSFRIFVHFMQHDFSGLTTATPEKRKSLLRDALSLVLYAKLEKIAKDKSNLLSREADKFKTMIETLGDPETVILGLQQKLLLADQELASRADKMSELEISQKQFNEQISILVSQHTSLENKFSSLLTKEQSLNKDKSTLETSLKEYNTKRINVIKIARDTIAEVKSLEEVQLKLVSMDFHQIDILSEQIITNKERSAQLNMTIQNESVRIEKLRKPIPKDGECEECRQLITEEHRKICQSKLTQELQQKQQNVQNYKKVLADLNTQNIVHQQNINQLTLSKQHLESLNTKITIKKNEIAEKRVMHDDYSSLINKYTFQLEEKNKEIEQVAKELKNSSIEEAKALQKSILTEKQKLASLTNEMLVLNKEITTLNSSKAVLRHDLTQKIAEKRKIIDYGKLLKEIEAKLIMYPSVIQAFSSTGIPNLIIQNVLDDLQMEANALLSQLKPGIQLSFFIEKTVEKTGDQADTLDINYLVNGKKRYYEQLSGAMQLAVTFSLKLGLSFLLQKLAGVEIKFLLLDEVDQSLDKASVDAFADIVKFFQKDFTILVITHNDRLKDKFSHAILVEQDINMVSKARVISSW